MDEKRKNTLYCPLLIKLPMQDHAINMSYVEILDETHIDMNHIHNSYEICFCLENRLIMNAGGCEHILYPGEFLLVMPGTPHNAVCDPDEKNKYFFMVFDPPSIDEYDEKTRPTSTQLEKISRSELFVSGACPVDEISLLLGKMERELIDRNAGWFFMFRGYCLEFIFCCLREVIGQIHESPKEIDNFNLAIEITKYMQNNLREKISLSDIATEMHISSRHAQRIFKDYFGVSFVTALNLYRINHAKNLLVSTGLSISDIAERVGLSSTQPLYRLFHEYENMSINEYRIKQRGLVAERSKSINSLVNQQNHIL